MDADGEYAPEDVSVLAAPVLAGTADAGVLRTCLLERLERDGSVPRGRLRVLSPQAQSTTCRSTSRLYPGWAFAAASGTPPELTRKVLFALLSLPPDANGQAWTVPADYHPVHELFRQLQIGPYAFLRETRWAYLAHRYWPWAAGLAILLVLWGFYTLHVEHLVQRRTRELTAVLAERQSLEERVRSGQQQMEHLSRLSILGELAGTLAHELNQPLAAIGNYARSLLRRQERGKLSDEALRQAAERSGGDDLDVAFDRLRDRGMIVIVVAHSAVVRFEAPDSDGYDRYQLRLHKQVEPLIVEWADAVLFCVEQTRAVKTEDGRKRGISTGQRVMHTVERAAWRAKNRYSLPAEMPLEWSSLQAAIEAHVAGMSIPIPDDERPIGAD